MTILNQSANDWILFMLFICTFWFASQIEKKFESSRALRIQRRPQTYLKLDLLRIRCRFTRISALFFGIDELIMTKTILAVQHINRVFCFLLSSSVQNRIFIFLANFMCFASAAFYRCCCCCCGACHSRMEFGVPQTWTILMTIPKVRDKLLP